MKKAGTGADQRGGGAEYDMETSAFTNLVERAPDRGV